MVTAILVAYRTPAELAAAVASLRAQSEPPAEIIIVDTGAADGDPVPDGAATTGATVLRPPENLGYGRGCNHAARTAAGNELLLLNADVVLTAEVLATLRRRLRSDSRVAAVGPRILSGGKLQLSARAFPSFRTGLLGRRSPLTRMLIRVRRYPAEFHHTYGDGGRVDWVSGACMLVRREAFEEVQGFDEGYFMYWEDADLCRRLAAAGWSVHYEPGAIVHHATGASGTSERTIRAFHESAARFAARHIARNGLEGRAVDRLLQLRSWVAVRSFRHARRMP